MSLSVAFYRLLSLKSQEEGWTDDKGNYFPPAITETHKAHEYFRLALHQDERDPNTLALYALFLEKIRNTLDAEKSFIKSIETDPRNGFAVYQYLNFLDRYGHLKDADELYGFLSNLLDERIVSPLSETEIGGVVKVYFEDESFKSVKVTSTMRTYDVIILVLRALKMAYVPFDCHLSIHRGGLPSLSPRQNPLPSSPQPHAAVEVLSANEFPWILLDRPSRKSSILVFQKRDGPQDLECARAHLIADSLPYAPPLLSSAVALLAELSRREERVYVLSLLFAYPLLLKGSKLLSLLLLNSNDAWVANVVSHWIINYPLFAEFTADEARFILGSFSSVSSDQLSEATEVRERYDREDVTIAQFIQHVKRHMASGSSPDRFLLRGCKQREIREVAEQLRVVSLSLKLKASSRDFLAYAQFCDRTRIPLKIAGGIAFERALKEWVVDEIADGKASESAGSLKSYEAFVSLSRMCLSCGDVSSSAAIVDALTSDRILPLHLVWEKEERDHVRVRSQFLRSPPHQNFASTAFQSRSDYFLSYLAAVHPNSSQQGFILGSYERMLDIIDAIGPVMAESGQLDMTRVFSLFRIIEGFTANLKRGTGFPHAHLGTINPRILNFFGRGPFAVIATDPSIFDHSPHQISIALPDIEKERERERTETFTTKASSRAFTKTSSPSPSAAASAIPPLSSLSLPPASKPPNPLSRSVGIPAGGPTRLLNLSKRKEKG